MLAQQMLRDAGPATLLPAVQLILSSSAGTISVQLHMRWEGSGRRGEIESGQVWGKISVHFCVK